MRWSMPIWLITPGEATFDNYGQLLPSEPKLRKVYGNEWSLKLTDRLAAGLDDLRNFVRIELHSFEYQGEEKFKLGDHVYSIEDVEMRGERVILLGAKRVGDG